MTSERITRPAGGAVGRQAPSGSNGAAQAGRQSPPTARDRLARYRQRLVDRHVVTGLALATGLGLFDLLDHTLGPVGKPATQLIVAAPLVTAVRANAAKTTVVAVYSSLLTLLIAPTHGEASTADLVVVGVVAVAASVLAISVAAARDRAQRAERERTRELRHLQRLLDVALEFVSLEELMPELLGRIGDALRADAAMFLLVDESARRLVLRAVTGLDAGGDAVSVRTDEGFAGTILASGAARAAHDFAEEQPAGEVDILLQERGMSSLVGVPLVESGELIGVLQIATLDRRQFDADDVRLLQAAADRAALAIRRARMYEREHHIATTLQRSLLPNRLPEIPGLELAVSYRAAGEAIDVGGDFYDAFCVDDRWWLVIGDVSGKGPAAAAMTALARYGLRDAASRSRTPGAVLAGLNKVMRREGEPEDVCSTACIALDPNGSGARACVALGGHPYPLILRKHGVVERVGRSGPLVGARATPDFPEESVALSAGDCMLLYTDGATEAPTAEGRLRVDGLATILATCDPAGGAGQVVEAIERRVEEKEIGKTADDRVILVLRGVGEQDSNGAKDGAV